MGMVYEDMARPDREEEAGNQARWDATKRIALEKLRLNVTTRVDDMITNGDELTEREYYLRPQGLFLRTGSESVATLQKRLAAFHQERIFFRGLLIGVPMWGIWLSYWGQVIRFRILTGNRRC